MSNFKSKELKKIIEQLQHFHEQLGGEVPKKTTENQDEFGVGINFIMKIIETTKKDIEK